ncbi:MAG: RNA-binding protein [Pseudomonadota bacterium]
MNPLLESLEQCESIGDLRPEMRSLCARYGAISRLDILPASHLGKKQALCFLRMATPEQEEKLVRELGVGRFGGDLILVVDLAQREAAGQHFKYSSQSTLGAAPRVGREHSYTAL